MICAAGGLLLTLAGLSVGWLIGALVAAMLLSMLSPGFFQLPEDGSGLPKSILSIGQLILGIELGMRLDASIMKTFQNNWLIILVMLVLTVGIAMLAGLVLWKFSDMDKLTSLFALAPGGLSVIPSVADEVGANTGLVTLIHTIRVFLVVLSIPIIISFLSPEGGAASASQESASAVPEFDSVYLLWTVIFVFVGLLGYYLGKKVRLPAPMLIGSMISVGLLQISSVSFFGYQPVAVWPGFMIIIAQILIGASIGSRFHKKMFKGLKKTLVVSSLCTIAMIIAVFGCSYIAAVLTDISLGTSVLAFTPGGISEMTTTAIAINEDSTFVVAVQVLRVIAVCLFLPWFVRYLHQHEQKNQPNDGR